MDTIEYNSLMIIDLIKMAYLKGMLENITNDEDLIELANFMIAHGAVVLVNGGLPINERD